MSQTAQQPTSDLRLRNFSIALAVAIVCFLIGGGWHLACDSDDIHGIFYRTETPHEKICAVVLLFMFGGGAAALIGATIAVCILNLLRRKKAEWCFRALIVSSCEPSC